MKRLFGRLICYLFGHPVNRVIQHADPEVMK